MTWLEARIPPPLVTLLCGWGMYLLVPGSPLLDWPLRSVLPALLVIAAARFALPAVRAFRRAGTTISPVQVERASALVTQGVFARSRNPMYLALSLLLGAWAAWLARPEALLGPALLMAWLTRFQILPEEHVLAARFGADYAAYRARVRRWL